MVLPHYSVTLLLEREEEIAELIEKRSWRNLVIARRRLFPPEGGRYAVLSEKVLRLSYRANLGAHWEMEEPVLHQLLDSIAEVEAPFGGPHTLNFLEDGRAALDICRDLNRRLGHFASRFLPLLRPALRRVARDLWRHHLEQKEQVWPPCVPSDETLARVRRYRLSEGHPAYAALQALPLERAHFTEAVWRRR